MTNESVLYKIETAKRELAQAQAALDTLLRTMEVASLAETTPVTKAVEDAFDRIQAAQARLVELRELLMAPAK